VTSQLTPHDEEELVLLEQGTARHVLSALASARFRFQFDRSCFLGIERPPCTRVLDRRELSQEIQGKLRCDLDNACLEVTLLISYSNRRAFAGSRFIYLRFWEVSL
jgi:hypothetical protein